METSASLLDRLRHRPDDPSWRRLDAIYRPLIQSWIQRDSNCATTPMISFRR